MILIEIRNGVRLLKAQGHSLREISGLLKLSRNAVRRILRSERARVAALRAHWASALGLIISAIPIARHRPPVVLRQCPEHINIGNSA